jgi:hypothetical protein
MTTRKEKIRVRQQAIVDDFNRRFPVGSSVILRKDSGEVATTVRSAGFVLEGHSAVAFFTGVCGCYSIDNDRVREAEPAASNS